MNWQPPQQHNKRRSNRFRVFGERFTARLRSRIFRETKSLELPRRSFMALATESRVLLTSHLNWCVRNASSPTVQPRSRSGYWALPQNLENFTTISNLARLPTSYRRGCWQSQLSQIGR